MLMNTLSKNTLGKKIIIILSICQIIFLASIVTVGFYFFNYTLQDQLDKRVAAFSSQFESSIKTALISRDLATLRSVGMHAINLPDITEFNIFLSNQLIISEKSNKARPKNKLTITKNVTSSGINLGAIVYSMSLDSISANKKNIYSTLSMICLLELIFASILAYILGRYVNKRSNYIIDGMQKYATGETDFKFSYITDDEFGIIASAFNLMTSRLNENTKRLEELRLQNIHSNKMAALGEMAASIAHEINNPLTIILGTTSSMTQSLPLEFKDKEIVEKSIVRIQNTAKRIAKIISALKTFSRNAEDDPFEDVEINKILEDSLTLCSERFVFNKIDLKLIIQTEKNVLVHCSATQLSQVFLNLLSNSFDAIEHMEDKWVIINVSVNKDRLLIKFTDCGKGIPDNLIDKIMEPFFTTKQVGKGTGIGLSISKNIIDNHNGLFYYEKASVNTCFVVELPIH